MTSTRVLIVDDEPLALERMMILLSRCAGVEVVGTAATGQAALRLADELSPDACFLDIGMPQMDGIEVAHGLAKLATPPRVVFVTAYDAFAVAAFDLDAIDYIVKPVDPARLTRALARIGEHARAPKAPPVADRYLQQFWASGPHGLSRIAIHDVERIVAERDYMRLHVGKRSWLINDSLARLEQELDPALFVRLHRSTIVRRDLVTGLRYQGGRWIATLAEGVEQKVGRLYAKNVRQLMDRR